MTAPTIDKLRAYLPLKTLTADGQSLTVFTATGASTAAILYSATLNQADATWNGALGFFKGDTLTAGLRGCFFHVRVSVAGYAIPAENLPVVPQAGDTFSLALGGNYRSSQEAFGLECDDALPELIEVAGANITGLVVKKASPMLGTGTLAIHYNSGAQTLTAKMGAGAYGTAVDASGNLSDVSLFIDADSGWVRVDCTAASLPVGDADDSWVLTQPKETFTPDIEGYEGETYGKVRYRLEVLTNTDPLTDMVDLEVYSDKPSGADTVIAAGQSLALVAANLVVSDATGWPLTGFWLYNSTKNDCRYVPSRSGNTLSVAAANPWMIAHWGAGTTSPVVGDVVTQSGKVAYVVDVYSSSAPFTCLFYRCSGQFSAGAYANTRGLTFWLNAVYSYGQRGLTAVAWEEGDTLQLMSDVDLLTEKPVAPATAFRTQATETVIGVGMQLFAHRPAGSPLALGTLRPGELVGVWRREWIPPEHVTRVGVSTDTAFNWS